MLGKSFPRKCELASQFPAGKPNLKSVASQTTEKMLSQILWAIPCRESLHKKSDYSRNWTEFFFSRKCELVSQFPVGKPNLKSVASQTTEKMLSQILCAIP